MNWNKVKDTWKRFTSSEKEKRVEEKLESKEGVDGKHHKSAKTVVSEPK
jgi:hypothetical protein